MIKSDSLPYGKIAHLYRAFLNISGFKRGVERFLDAINFNLPPLAKILDAGCGTGLLALYLAKRFPNAKIYATDIDANMLGELAPMLAKSRINGHRFIMAQSDLKEPEKIKAADGEETIIPPDYFDAIFASGAMEHARPLAASTARLIRLLKPGGTFFNLGMRKNATGAVLTMMYKVRPYTIAEMRSANESAGLEDTKVIRLSADYFPANLSRVAVIAKKRKNV